MTQTQKQALAVMAERNSSAIHTSLGWTWLEDIRQSDEAATAVLAAVWHGELGSDDSAS